MAPEVGSRCMRDVSGTQDGSEPREDVGWRVSKVFTRAKETKSPPRISRSMVWSVILSKQGREAGLSQLTLVRWDQDLADT